jgi:hypothetical protein
VTWYLNVLKSNNSPLAEKQLALDYLVHLVGDLHLPLHVRFLESHEISEDYVKRAMPILHRRLVQAGVRLAWLLNDALK